MQKKSFNNSNIPFVSKKKKMGGEKIFSENFCAEDSAMVHGCGDTMPSYRLVKSLQERHSRD